MSKIWKHITPWQYRGQNIDLSQEPAFINGLYNADAKCKIDLAFI